MVQNPIFFFSYTHNDRECSYFQPDIVAEKVNYVDEFFDQLCQRVAELKGIGTQDAGFRDRDKIAVGTRWSPELRNALNRAHVLVALITPRYLKDPNDSCGREFGAFLRRYEAMAEATRGDPRIVPVLWTDEDACWREAREGARDHLRAMQYQNADFPNDYVTLGLHQIRRTKLTPQDYNKSVYAVAKRIVELSSGPPLPPLGDNFDFSQMPSAFVDNDGEPAIVHPQPVDTRNLVPAAIPDAFVGGSAMPGLTATVRIA